MRRFVQSTRKKMPYQRVFCSAIITAFLSIAPFPTSASLTIRSVDLYEYKIPRTSVFKTAKGSSSTTPGIFIRITAVGDEGIAYESWGDALPRQSVTNESRADAWTGAELFSKILLGKELPASSPQEDFARVKEWMTELQGAASIVPLTTDKPPAPNRQLRATLCGFETALLGLAAAYQDLPLHELFGPRERDDVSISGLTANAGISPKEGAARVKGARPQYRCVRLKIGADPASDLKMLTAVAETIVSERPDLEIFVDVNQAWGDASTSIEELSRIRAMLKEVGFQGRFICEQPTHEFEFEELAAVTKTVRKWRQSDEFAMLIMADEILWDQSDLSKLVALDAVDQVNFKIQKSGGLIETVEMGRYLAEKKPDWEVYVGGLLMTDVGAMANLQVGYALPRLDYMTGAIPRRSEVVNPATNPLSYQRGTRTLLRPEQAGYGTAVNLAILENYITQTASFSL